MAISSKNHFESFESIRDFSVQMSTIEQNSPASSSPWHSMFVFTTRKHSPTIGHRSYFDICFCPLQTYCCYLLWEDLLCIDQVRCWKCYFWKYHSWHCQMVYSIGCPWLLLMDRRRSIFVLLDEFWWVTGKECPRSNVRRHVRQGDGVVWFSETWNWGPSN